MGFSLCGRFCQDRRLLGVAEGEQSFAQPVEVSFECRWVQRFILAFEFFLSLWATAGEASTPLIRSLRGS